MVEVVQKCKPMAESCSNTGHYHPPRWTCCACYHELGNVGEGAHVCPRCDHLIVCEIDKIPSFITRLADETGDQ